MYQNSENLKVLFGSYSNFDCIPWVNVDCVFSLYTKTCLLDQDDCRVQLMKANIYKTHFVTK